LSGPVAQFVGRRVIDAGFGAVSAPAGSSGLTRLKYAAGGAALGGVLEGAFHLTGRMTSEPVRTQPGEGEPTTNGLGGVDTGMVHGPIKPGEIPISVQRQAGHISGTPQYANRLKVNKPTSAWDPAIDADAYTQYAWEYGTPSANNANVRAFDFDHPVGAGGFGGTQAQVTVSLNPTTGEIHGYPSGPVTR
jgi:hypothetical protein